MTRIIAINLALIIDTMVDAISSEALFTGHPIPFWMRFTEPLVSSICRVAITRMTTTPLAWNGATSTSTPGLTVD